MSYYNGQRAINSNTILYLDSTTKKSVDSMVLTTQNGYGSVSFNGSNGYLAVPALPGGPFDFGSSNFTIEAWINTPTLAYDQTIVAQHGVGDVNKFSFRVNLHTDGTISFRSYQNQTTFVDIRNTSSLAINTWNHIAITSTSRYITIFLNGSGSVGTFNTYIPQVPSRASLLSIGAIRIRDGRIVNHFSGYISNLRIVKGTALYANSFSPPIQSLTNVSGTSLLTCQNNSIVDNSSNNFNINIANSTTTPVAGFPSASYTVPFAYLWKDLSGNDNHGYAASSSLYSTSSIGSIAFNGSGSKLIISSSTLLNPTGGAMTFWADAYPADTGSNRYNPIIFKQNNYTSSGVEQYSIFFSGSNFGCTATGTDRIIKQLTASFINNAVASVTSSTSYCAVINTTASLMKLYVDGVLVATGSGPTSFDTSSNPILIGSRVLNSFDFTGSISNVKIYNRELSSSEILTNFYSKKPASVFIPGDGLSATTAANSAVEILAINPAAVDGVYWINLPVVGATRVYCIMNSLYDGGGWMMMMKATRGATFNYDATYWTTANTLNPTDLTQNDADAKYNVMNYFYAKDMLARWPDITTSAGGSIPGLGTHIWLQNSFATSNTLGNTINTVLGRVIPISMFNQASRNFIGDAKLYNGWQSGIFSSQTDVRFYGYNYYSNGATLRATRWGFGWNENGGGLFPNGDMTSDDVFGGIGLKNPAYSAGDNIIGSNDTTGINRTARVEVYVR